jgi:hypothetical protein
VVALLKLCHKNKILRTCYTARQSRQTLSELIGKAEPFRKESGKAAFKGKVAQKNKNLGTCYTH